jgi:hypothetical protein
MIRVAKKKCWLSIIFALGVGNWLFQIWEFRPATCGTGKMTNHMQRIRIQRNWHIIRIDLYFNFEISYHYLIFDLQIFRTSSTTIGNKKLWEVLIAYYHFIAV